MGEPTDSDEVDLYVGGVDCDADSLLEVSRLIASYKQRPDYRAKLEEARKILADVGIDPHNYGMPDAKTLLDHWHRCIDDLTSNGAERPHADQAKEKSRALN